MFLQKMFAKRTKPSQEKAHSSDEQALKQILFKLGIGSGDSVASSGEELASEVLQRHYAPPFCVFDVGANKGGFLRLALEKLDGGGVANSLL